MYLVAEKMVTRTTVFMQNKVNQSMIVIVDTKRGHPLQHLLVELIPILELLLPQLPALNHHENSVLLLL